MAKGNINEDTTFEAMERGRLFRKFLSDYYNYKAQTGNPVFALKISVRRSGHTYIAWKTNSGGMGRHSKYKSGVIQRGIV